MMIAIVVSWLGLGVMVGSLLWRGDGRTDLRRCPRCWSDMSGTAAMTCPTCGHAARSELELHQPRRIAKPRLRLAVALWAMLLMGAWCWIPGQWAHKVPTPLLVAALSVTAPAPTPTVVDGMNGLPAPDERLRRSRSSWTRLVWNHQASVALQAWWDAVLAGDGPISDEELSRLVPLADQAHDIHQRSGLMTWGDGVSIDRLRLRVARALRASAGDPDRAIRHAWVLSEMQYEGAESTHRPDFGREPDAIILQALGHSDPRVRLFGVERFSRRVHRVVVARTSPKPAGWDLVRAIADSDPDAAVRARASSVLEYADIFLFFARR